MQLRTMSTVRRWSNTDTSYINRRIGIGRWGKMKQINPEIFDLLKQQQKVTLGFSGGKDSLACAVILKALEINFIPFYFYLCPELFFVEKTLTTYEKLLDIKIIRLPHPMLYDFLSHNDFMPPPMIEYLCSLNLPKLTFENLVDCYIRSTGDNNIYYDIVGMRASESFNRRKFFKKKQNGIDHITKKIFPVFDWNKSDVLQLLKEKNIPLSDDYKIWNRSYDAMKYQFLFGVKKHYPEDYEKIKEYFPLIDLEIFRYDQNKKYF